MWVHVLVDVGPEGPGALEVLAADGSVLATAAVPDPRVRSILLPDDEPARPGGHGSATLAAGTIRVRVPWPEGAVAVRGGRSLTRAASGGAVPVLEGGPAEERLDLVVLGDGYTAGQLDAFAGDVDELVDYLLDVQPYERYADLLNVWRVDRASGDPGITHPGDPRDTAFGCAYDCAGVDRLVCCDDGRVLATVEDALPAYDGVIVLLNDPEYGGSGGFNYATAYTGTDGVRVAAHELGHSLVGLWDEYSYGVSGEGQGPNCARSSDRWDDWLGVNGVGEFSECSFTNLVRPTDEGCMMRTLRDGYCPVCREEVILAMHRHLGGLVRTADPPPGEGVVRGGEILVETSVPADRLAFEWTLDGEVVAETPSARVRCSGWNGELALRVHDPTGWVRRDPDGLLEDELGTWQVEAGEPCAPLACGCAQGASGPGSRPPGSPAALFALLAWRRRRC